MRRSLLPVSRQDVANPAVADPFTSLQREVNRMFDDAWRNFGAASSVTGALMAPRVDYSEDDANLYVTAELPGLNEDDVEVSFEDGVLRLSGEKAQSHEDTQRNLHVSERVYGRFAREVPIGREVKTAEIAASFKDGVLTVTLPKATESQATRKIKVKRAA